MKERDYAFLMLLFFAWNCRKGWKKRHRGFLTYRESWNFLLWLFLSDFSAKLQKKERKKPFVVHREVVQKSNTEEETRKTLQYKISIRDKERLFKLQDKGMWRSRHLFWNHTQNWGREELRQEFQELTGLATTSLQRQNCSLQLQFHLLALAKTFLFSFISHITSTFSSVFAVWQHACSSSSLLWANLHESSISLSLLVVSKLQRTRFSSSSFLWWCQNKHKPNMKVKKEH